MHRFFCTKSRNGKFFRYMKYNLEKEGHRYFSSTPNFIDVQTGQSFVNIGQSAILLQ